jgi:tRNA(Ile)-lysidine synthase
VLERVTSTARRYQMFEPGGRVLIAVSGGPDSMCLLHSLVRLKRLLRQEMVCFHFDHRLRPGSDRDADYVRAQAKRLGIPFVLRSAESTPGRGESIEAWARTVRYGALLAALEELGGSLAALGHTADDQAETVLLAMFRGGGLEAISGMRPVSVPLVRPLLEVTREETEAFCRSLRLRPRHDPMNEDPSFMRVAIRKEILPSVERALGRGVRSTLARTASHLTQDARLLDTLARVAAERVVVEEGSSRSLRAGPLRDLPTSLSTRIVRRQFIDLGVLPDAAQVEAVLDLIGRRPGSRRSLSGGLRAERGREYVTLSRSSPRPRR